MRVVVVSPHLDDAVLSLGATMHSLTRRGLDVELVTVFAGDPDQEGVPSYWDSRRGVDRREAIAQRRAEDAAAADVLGAHSTWLPFDDSAYPAARDPAAIWALLEPLLAPAAVVLVPGWPLTHADHRFVTMLVAERLVSSIPVFAYAEMPYAAHPANVARWLVRGRRSAAIDHIFGAHLEWAYADIADIDLHVKRRAVACYVGEVVALGRDATLATLHDRLLGREAVARRDGQRFPGYLVEGRL